MKSILFLMLSLFAYLASAQQTKYSTEDKRALKYYEEARQYLKRSQFREAMEPLQDALSKDPDFIEGWLAMGSANYRLQRDSLALLCFDRALEIDPDYRKSIYAYFLIGEINFKQANYQKAKDYLVHYISREDADPKKNDLATEMISNCLYALEAVRHPYDYNIRVLPDHANDFQLQYFPVLSVDMNTLYFTRREGLSVQMDEDIYYCDLLEDSTWSVPVSISDYINSEFNEGAPSLSADGRMLVFTSCDGRRGFGSCDIYVSYKKGKEWSVPENMGSMINSGAWDAQASLSADGRSIYFVSNRSGGYGSKDIWMASKNKKGLWEPAVNLGRTVNSKKDEISPFIHVNGESLYFSSNGYDGLGGLDVYWSERRDSTWSDPVNLGYPLNDEHDQVSLYISSTGTQGCYTIEKKQGRYFESKLYAFDLPDTFQVTHQSSYLKGTIVDADTDLPVAAEIKVYNLKDEKYYSRLTADQVSGAYTLVLTEGNQYGVYVSAPGYLFTDFSFSFDDIKAFDQNLLGIRLEPVKIGMKTVLGNIFYDFDEFTLKRESMSELKEIYQFLRKNPKIKVEISGHTDSSGSNEYNLVLSEKRAKSVYDFLIFKRIKREQISYRGYGSLKPLYSIENTALAHKNRRIEFSVVAIDD